MKSNVVYMLIICSIFALSCKARTEYSQAKDVKSSLKKFNIEYDITEFRALSAENLPAVINLKLGGGIGRAIYANDVKDWEAAFDIREFESLLKSAQMDGKLEKNKLQRIQTIRKSGSILRSTFIVFDARHKPPKLFAKLIQDMGKLSDAIALNDFDASKTIANGLAKLVRDNHQLIDSELEGYMQADATSVVQKLLSEQKFSQLALKNDFLTVDRFHALRNSIRLLLDLIRHLEAINKVFTPESVQYLVDLNKAFGHAHDTALKMTQGLSEEDALNSTMRVYSEVKAAANNFFSRLKIDLE